MTSSPLRTLLWILVGALCAIGLVMVASTTALPARGEATMTLGMLVRQAAAMCAGVMAAAVISTLGTSRLREGRWVALVVVCAAVGVIAALAFGRTINGARRWIDLGPINLQPAELAKIAIVVWVSWHFARVAEQGRSFWHGVVAPSAGFLLLAGLVYLTRDLGSVVVMGLVLFAMLFFARAPWGWFATLGGMGVPLLAYYTVYQVAYRRDRLLAFLDPWSGDSPAAYHLRQSLVAVGSGGLLGIGLGEGAMGGVHLPERHTDFIFAVVCQELGMTGAMTVAGLFLALAAVGFAIAAGSRDQHRRLLAAGATVAICGQGFWNMLVVLGTVPTKGLTLPFISYGGSSVVACLVLVGLLDAVARENAAETVMARPVGGISRASQRLRPATLGATRSTRGLRA